MKIKPFPLTLPSAVDEYTLGNLAANSIVLEQLIDLLSRSFAPIAGELAQLRQRLHEGQDFSHEFAAIRYLTSGDKSDGELAEVETFKLFADDQPKRHEFTNWLYRSGLMLSHPSLTPALSLPKALLVEGLPPQPWDSKLPYYEAFSALTKELSLIEKSMLLTRSNEVEDIVLIPLQAENLYLGYALDRMEWCLIRDFPEQKLLVISHYISGFFDDVEDLKAIIHSQYVLQLGDDAKKYLEEDESAATTIEVMNGKMFELARQLEGRVSPIKVEDGAVFKGVVQLGNNQATGPFFSYAGAQGEVLLVQNDPKRIFFVTRQPGNQSPVLLPVALDDLSTASGNILVSVLKQSIAAMKTEAKERTNHPLVGEQKNPSKVESPAAEAKRVQEARGKVTAPRRTRGK